MKRIFGILCIAFMMMSCTSPMVGTWIQPQTSATQEEGFILHKDGSASSVNLDFIEFTAWEKDGDFLILNGFNNGSVKKEFSDTMKIESVSKTTLVLSQNGYRIEYNRK
ncbi:MAG TPA: lipocalin family protein [Bacteroidetes bacterium]|nr:lipocalin family protein [Candidatus Limimorpha avicola]